MKVIVVDIQKILRTYEHDEEGVRLNDSVKWEDTVEVRSFKDGENYVDEFTSNISKNVGKEDIFSVYVADWWRTTIASRKACILFCKNSVELIYKFVISEKER